MGEQYDPILVEVIRNELEATMDELRIAVRKTGRSPLVKIGDFAAELCDASGRAIGVGWQTMMNPLLAGQARRVIDSFGNSLQEGDVFMVNDPYSGGSHVPDVLIVVPLFWREQLVAFVSIHSHHTDMGGRFPGSQSGQACSTYEEGIRIPLVRFERGGERNVDFLRLILANVRATEDFVGDVNAKIAGAWRAGQNLTSTLDKYGIEHFQACCDYLNNHGARSVSEAIRSVPAGQYQAEILLDDDGTGRLEAPLPIRVTLMFEGDRLTVDFAGTSPQVRGGVNLPFENLRGIVLYTIRELLAPDLPLNDGFSGPIEIVSPPGTLTNPDFPAATAGRATLMFLVDEAIHRALSRAVPTLVPVPREHWDVLHYSGLNDDGAAVTLMDLFSGGWGARPADDGVDGVAQSATVTLPVELLEQEFPIVIEGFGLEQDTGGAGQFRGSLAIYRRFRFQQPGHVMIRTNRLRPSMGLFGGQAGAPSTNIYTSQGVEAVLPAAAYTHLECGAGDILHHRVGGSGGFGSAYERDPISVLADVEEGRVSVGQAREVYGVEITVSDGLVSLDASKTASRRASMTETSSPRSHV